MSGVFEPFVADIFHGLRTAESAYIPPALF